MNIMMMWPQKKFIVPETALALLFRDEQFIQILPAGVHKLWNLQQQHVVKTIDITKPLSTPVTEDILYLARLHPEKFASHLLQWETGAYEVGLLYQNEVLVDIKAPAQTGAYWQGQERLELRKVDIRESFKLEPDLANLLLAAKNQPLRNGAIESIAISIIPEGQLGLLEIDGKLMQVLAAGTHVWWKFNRKITAKNVNRYEALDSATLKLVDEYPEVFAGQIQSWETAEQEVGLVYQNNVLKDIFAPAQRGAYWLTPQPITVKKIDISTDFSVDKELARILLESKDPVLSKAVQRALLSTQIAESHIGFLELEGKAYSTLTQGRHAWWAFNRRLNIKEVDLRLQNMEVNGQEILTKDRVSLRINLSATWQITDAELVKSKLADANEFLYRELQLALRTVVSLQTLDELLEDKNALNQQVLQIAAEKALVYGITLTSVGARDVVLPGDMKQILAQVVEAQKLAEANLIKRREETQATRSLHNTAKVMEGNPILLRLKELEVLEKITANVQHLNVYGGLNGVMSDLVRINAN